jgi:drug/metabolite transporter (DMT)-like permease
MQRLWSSPIFLLTATALMWAGNTIAGRLAVGEVSPLALTFLRWAFVIVVLWPLFGREVRERWSDISPKLGRIIAMAALGYTGFNALYYIAAHHTTAINMGILQGTVPVFVLLGAFLVHGTRASLAQMLGVLITMVGVVVVATKGAPQDLIHLGLNPGDLALIIACILYAFYTIGLKDRPTLSGAGFFTLMALVAAVTSVPLVVWEAMRGDLMWPTLTGWLVVVWIAVFPSTLAQLCYLRGVDLIGPGRAGVYVNLVPVFAAALGVGLIGEPFGWYHAAALALVFAGIWLTQRTTA